MSEMHSKKPLSSCNNWTIRYKKIRHNLHWIILKAILDKKIFKWVKDKDLSWKNGLLRPEKVWQEENDTNFELDFFKLEKCLLWLFLN